MKCLVLSAMALVVAAGSAAAADLYTAPFWSGDFTDNIACRIGNVSATPKTVQVKIYDQVGTVVLDSGAQSVASQNEYSISSGPASLFLQLHCGFHVTGGKNTVRAEGLFISSGNEVFSVVAE